MPASTLSKQCVAASSGLASSIGGRATGLEVAGTGFWHFPNFVATVPDAAGMGFQHSGTGFGQGVDGCTPAVIPGAAPPRPRLGRGRRIMGFEIHLPLM